MLAMPLRAVIYARVSSKGQRDRHTVESQLRTLPGFVAAQGWTLARPADHYVDDGLSARAGQLAAREAFARLLADAALGEFDVVAVADIDRLTRTKDMEERGKILGAFQRAGVVIAEQSGQTHDLNSSMGDLTSGLRAYFASEENKKRREQSIRGQLTAIGRGRNPRGGAPYGLLYDRLAGIWTEDPKAAPVVRECYARVAAGDSGETIARDLEVRAAPRPRHGAWHRARIADIIRSTTYRGEYQAHRADGLVVRVPPLVDVALWHQANEALAAGGHRGLRRTKHIYLLEGLALCAVCQDRIRIGSAIPAARMVSKYVCASRRSRNAEPCALPLRKTAEVDDRLWAAMVRILGRRDLLDRALEIRGADAAKQGDDWSADLRGFESRLAKLLRAEKTMLERFRRGLVSEGAIDHELEAIARERKMLERQVETAQRAAAGAAKAASRVDAMRASVAVLQMRIRATSAAERRALVEALVDPWSVVIGAERVEAPLRLRLPESIANAPPWSTVREGCAVDVVEFRLVA